MTPHQRGGGHIVFGMDRVGVGVSVGVSVTLSCLHDISGTTWQILAKFALGDKAVYGHVAPSREVLQTYIFWKPTP